MDVATKQVYYGKHIAL